VTFTRASKSLIGKRVRIVQAFELRDGVTRFAKGEIVTVDGVWRRTLHVKADDKRYCRRIPLSYFDNAVEGQPHVPPPAPGTPKTKRGEPYGSKRALKVWYTDVCKRLQERDGQCQADRDGDCNWIRCPQMLDVEPAKSGRHCPLDIEGAEL
jgi:hypothetical protein